MPYVILRRGQGVQEVPGCQPPPQSRLPLLGQTHLTPEQRFAKHKIGKRSKQSRLVEIEDRKIEILLEIGRVNKGYGETVSSLEYEYDELDSEHFRLKLELMRSRGQG